jgi:hypothetical protein
MDDEQLVVGAERRGALVGFAGITDQRGALAAS